MEEWSYIYKNLKPTLENRRNILLERKRQKYMKLYGPKEI
jgi:hypothetical protein